MPKKQGPKRGDKTLTGDNPYTLAIDKFPNSIIKTVIDRNVNLNKRKLFDRLFWCRHYANMYLIKWLANHHEELF